MYKSVLHACMFVHHYVPGAYWDQKRPWDPLGQELDSCELSAAAAGNETQVLCSHLSSLFVNFYSFTV